MLRSEICLAKMSGEEGKETRKEGESASKVSPDEPAVLQELEDRVWDRLLRKVREEAGSEEPGEPKYVDTASTGKKLGSWTGPGSVRQPYRMCWCAACAAACRHPPFPHPIPTRWDIPARPKIGHTEAAAGWWQWV